MSIPQFDQKDMPFRRLGPSGLRVPVFCLGGCNVSSQNHSKKNLLNKDDRAYSWSDRSWRSRQRNH